MVSNSQSYAIRPESVAAARGESVGVVDLQTRRYLADVRAHLADRGFATAVKQLGPRTVLELDTPPFSVWDGTLDLVWELETGWHYRGLFADRSPSRFLYQPLPVAVFAAPQAVGRWLHRLVMGDLDLPAEADVWPGLAG